MSVELICDINGKPLEEVDCFKYHWPQVAADGGFQRYLSCSLNE